MKLVIIEPLGVEKETLLEIADKAVGKDAEIVYYDTRVTDDATLIERGKDADIIVVANLPLNETVIDGCKNLKLLAVDVYRDRSYCGGGMPEEKHHDLQLRGLFQRGGIGSGVWASHQSLPQYHSMQ